MTRPQSADRPVESLGPHEREEVQLWLLYCWFVKRGYDPKEIGL